MFGWMYPHQARARKHHPASPLSNLDLLLSSVREAPRSAEQISHREALCRVVAARGGSIGDSLATARVLSVVYGPPDELLQCASGGRPRFYSAPYFELGWTSQNPKSPRKVNSKSPCRLVEAGEGLQARDQRDGLPFVDGNRATAHGLECRVQVCRDSRGASDLGGR